MRLWTPETVDAAQDLASLPDRAAVVMIFPREGKPYLGRTVRLQRRLLRLLSLRQVASRIEYRLTASGLEASLVFYDAARAHFPQDYRHWMKLRMPPYVKIQLANPFPRSYVTGRLGGSSGLLYGPFRTRALAEQFESQFLNLFQIRRCQENLSPSPDHPGCIYGEMNMCLRPCQQVVGAEEYRSEVNRVVEFLSSGGRSLVDTLVKARERSSEEMDFEEAARLHKLVEKVQGVLKLPGDLACDIDHLCGVAVTRSVTAGSVELWFVLQGCWLDPVRFSVEASGRTVSLDQRLRELVSSLHPVKLPSRERQEHLALLARWYYSTTRDGDWLAFPSLEEVPYRKLVRAISRQA